MGWRASLFVIQNTAGINSPDQIINAIVPYRFEKLPNSTLDGCINPDNHMYYVGFYNDTIIVTLPGEETLEAIHSGSSDFERRLHALCPEAESLIAMCESTVNMHGYAINKGGQRIRSKIIASEIPKYEEGQPIEEELTIYARAEQDNSGQYTWEIGDHKYEEDQLMEDFTFGIAKRLLGVQLDHSDGDELMGGVPFHAYRIHPSEVRDETTAASSTSDTDPVLQQSPYAGARQEDAAADMIVDTDNPELPPDLQETLDAFDQMEVTSTPKVLEKRVYPEAKNKTFAWILIVILFALIYFLITR